MTVITAWQPQLITANMPQSAATILHETVEIILELVQVTLQVALFPL